MWQMLAMTQSCAAVALEGALVEVEVDLPKRYAWFPYLNEIDEQ